MSADRDGPNSSYSYNKNSSQRRGQNLSQNESINQADMNSNGGGAVRSVMRSFQKIAKSVKSATLHELQGLSHAHPAVVSPTTVAATTGTRSAISAAKSAGTLGFAVEAKNEESREESKHKHRGGGGGGGAGGGTSLLRSAGHSPDQLGGAWKRTVTVVVTGLPSFIKATVLGTLLFEIYQTTANRMSNYFLEAATTVTDTGGGGATSGGGASSVVKAPSNLCVPQQAHLVVAHSLIATGAGAVGGLAHALGYVLWSHGLGDLRRWMTREFAHGRAKPVSAFLTQYGVIGVGGRYFAPLPPVHALGTCLSHSLVHASLFGSYVATKLVLLGAVEETLLPLFSKLYDASNRQNKPNETDSTSSTMSTSSSNNISRSQALIKCEQYCGFMCIVLAGGVAGVVSEGVAAAVEYAGLESVGVRKALSNLKTHAQPGVYSQTHIRGQLTPTPRTLTLSSILPLLQTLPRTIANSGVFTVSSLLPNVLGFLAYEYGKEMINSSSSSNNNISSSTNNNNSSEGSSDQTTAAQHLAALRRL